MRNRKWGQEAVKWGGLSADDLFETCIQVRCVSDRPDPGTWGSDGTASAQSPWVIGGASPSMRHIPSIGVLSASAPAQLTGTESAQPADLRHRIVTRSAHEHHELLLLGCRKDMDMVESGGTLEESFCGP